MTARAAVLPAILGILAVGGCGPKPIYRTGSLDAPRQPSRNPTDAPADVREPADVPQGPIETALTAQADSWIGVPYRYGGTTRKGVDCSALAAALLDEVGIRLPRSVAEQRGVGHRVERDEVEAGDLVFFRMESSRVNHVGVALDESRFVHASRSRGVTIDRLDDDYFGKRVAETRRVLAETPEAAAEETPRAAGEGNAASEDVPAPESVP